MKIEKLLSILKNHGVTITENDGSYLASINDFYLQFHRSPFGRATRLEYFTKDTRKMRLTGGSSPRSICWWLTQVRGDRWRLNGYGGSACLLAEEDGMVLQIKISKKTLIIRDKECIELALDVTKNMELRGLLIDWLKDKGYIKDS